MSILKLFTSSRWANPLGGHLEWKLLI